ncbi:MAG TPA: rhodanese-like domain-containing protein [Acetobacteraceae bacterium]|nr:rhodanese-like domain-containing protein [Acetobacteraceae bacterium]
MRQRKPVVVDAGGTRRSIPDAIGLRGAGGNVSDPLQQRLRHKMRDLTGGDMTTPIVALAWNAERQNSRNLALRLVALGYTKVYWYRGGREAWAVAGRPEIELTMQDW